METPPLRTKILETIIRKSTLKQKVFDNTFAAFNLLKETLLEMASEMDDALDGRLDRRVWVACSNRERGAVARKTCKAACIGCSKCVKTCPFGAVEVNHNLSYINPDLCKTCGKCVASCPTGAILTSFTIPAKTATES